MLNKMILGAALLAGACGGSQTTTETTRMELRASEGVQIAELFGCQDYDIEEVDSVEGSSTREYEVSCVDGSDSGTVTCEDGAGCAR